MARYTTMRGDHIEYGFWLIFDSAGSVRITRGEPDVGRFERAMSLTARLPKSLFRTPTLRASLTVDNSDAPAALDFDIDVATAALKQAIGVDIDLSVIVPPCD